MSLDVATRPRSANRLLLMSEAGWRHGGDGQCGTVPHRGELALAEPTRRRWSFTLEAPIRASSANSYVHDWIRPSLSPLKSHAFFVERHPSSDTVF